MPLRRLLLPWENGGAGGWAKLGGMGQWFLGSTLTSRYRSLVAELFLTTSQEKPDLGLQPGRPLAVVSSAGSFRGLVFGPDYGDEVGIPLSTKQV